MATLLLECPKEAIASFNKALELKDDLNEPWSNRGFALYRLGRLDEAIASFDRALNIKPDLHEVWYNKACCYALQGNVEQAIANLQQAIKLNPDTYRELAKTDSDFDNIREDERFQTLIQGESNGEEGETDVERDIIIRMEPMSRQPAKLNVKHLGRAKLRVVYDSLPHDITENFSVQ